MSMVAMGKCEQHPQCSSSSVRGEGVCAICLQKKLTHVWHGERRDHSGVSTTNVVADPRASSTAHGEAVHSPVHVPRETLAIIGSIASIAKRTQQQPSTRKPHPSFDWGVTEGGHGGEPEVSGTGQDIEAVIKDWAALHARRRSSQGKTTTTTATTMKKKKKRVTIMDESGPMMECFISRAGLPLVDRIAKETAMRVIKEVGDDAISVDDFHEELMSRQIISEDNNVCEDVNVNKSGKKGEVMMIKSSATVKSSPGNWHSKIRAKWVKGLVTNSSKVFPSKSVENVQKASPARSDHAKMKSFQVIKQQSAEKRKALRFNVEPTVIPRAKGVYESGFTSETVIEGMPDEILKHEDMNQRLVMSYNAVLSWLQDLPSPQAPLFLQIGEPEEDPSPPEPWSNDSHGKDLPLNVGYLHEIVEEHENIEEVSTTNQLSVMSSFGKFLIPAADRQPRHQGLSRVVTSAISGR